MPEHPVTQFRVLSEEEATSVERPKADAWKWSEPINAIVSDSWKWRHYAENDPELGPVEWRIAQSAIENLYRNGYAVVKLEASDGD